MIKKKNDKLPHSVPLRVDERVREKVHPTGRAKIQYMLSDEIYIVVRTTNMPGDPYIIKKVKGDDTALRVTGC